MSAPGHTPVCRRSSVSAAQPPISVSRRVISCGTRVDRDTPSRPPLLSQSRGVDSPAQLMTNGWAAALLVPNTAARSGLRSGGEGVGPVGELVPVQGGGDELHPDPDSVLSGGGRRGDEEVDVAPLVEAVGAGHVPGSDESAVDKHVGALIGDGLVEAAAEQDPGVERGDGEVELAGSAVGATVVGDVDGVRGALVLIGAGPGPSRRGDTVAVTGFAARGGDVEGVGEHQPGAGLLVVVGQRPDVGGGLVVPAVLEGDPDPAAERHGVLQEEPVGGGLVDPVINQVGGIAAQRLGVGAVVEVEAAVEEVLRAGAVEGGGVVVVDVDAFVAL